MPLTTPGYVTGFPGAGLNQFDNMLKELYGKLIESHLHKATETLEFLRGAKGRLGGRRTVEAVVIGRPQSVHQYALERSPLPTPTTGEYVNTELDAKFAFMRLRETFQVNKLSSGGGRNSFSPSRSKEYALAREQAKINAERHVITGQKDILGTVASHAVVSSTSVITLDSRDSRSSTNPWRQGGRFFEKGMSVSLVPTANGAGGAPSTALEAGGRAREIRVRAVANKHGSAPAITIERGNEDNSAADANLTGAPWSVTPAAGDFIIPWNSRAGTISAGNEAFWDFATPWGLMDIIGSTFTANFLGLAKATYPTFASVYDSNSGVARQITESLIYTKADQTMNEGGGMPLDFAIGEHSIRREIQALYQSRQEFGAVISEVGAKEKFMFNLGAHRIPFISNWLFPIGLLVMGVKGECGWYSLQDYAPLDEGLARRFVPDYAQSEEVYVSAGNWTCMAPNAFCGIDDLVASTQTPPAGGL